jgi:uncharacterized protein YaeQ
VALKSTIYKIQISVADLTKNHYEDYSLTTAKHPSESDDRLASRIIAFALHAHEDLSFGRGLSDEKEPDLWIKSLDGRILKWIYIGQPDPKRLRQVCGKSDTVDLFCYQLSAAQAWWNNAKRDLAKLPKLQVSFLNVTGESKLSSIIQRTMDINCTIEDGSILLSSNTHDHVNLTLDVQQIKSRG